MNQKSLCSIIFLNYQDNIWRLWDQDWPCLSPDRFVFNSDAGDPALLDEAYFSQIISNFSGHLVKNKA
jgi:hypothetical protein